jgi:hypothetical protein
LATSGLILRYRSGSKLGAPGQRVAARELTCLQATGARHILAGDDIDRIAGHLAGPDITEARVEDIPIAIDRPGVRPRIKERPVAQSSERGQ